MKTQYVRKGKSIRTIGTDEVKVFGSINLAKKASRKIQILNGGLNCGVLVKS